MILYIKKLYKPEISSTLESLHVRLVFLEQRSQNVSCSTGVPLQAAVGLHHQDQVREQHHHTEVPVTRPCREEKLISCFMKQSVMFEMI